MCRFIWVVFLLFFLRIFVNNNSFKYCPISAFHEMQQLEDDIRILISTLFGELKYQLLQADLVGLNLIFKDMKLAGSITEGSFSARLFENDQEFSDGLHRQYEADLEFTMFEIDVKFQDIFLDIPGKPGFLQIYIGNGMSMPDAVTRFFDYATRTRLSSLVDPLTGYLLSNKIKELYAREMHFGKDHVYVKVAKLLTSFLTYVPFTEISISHVIAETTKATSTFAFDILIHNQIGLKFSSDFAFVIRCNWSPYIYNTLRLRWSSTWIASLNLTSELKISYVIAKSSNEQRNAESTTEFRYSFAHLERKLISYRTPQQREVYLMFKSLFYRWLKPLDPVRLSSFICKCTMLWLVETHPPDDPIWLQTTSAKPTALYRLLHKLQSYFEKGHMPYYFIPSMNILQRIPTEVTAQAVHILSRIQSNYPLFLPLDRIELIQSYLQTTRSSILTVHNFLEASRNGNVWLPLYLKRPNLVHFLKDLAATRKLSYREKKIKNVCNVDHDTNYLLNKHKEEQIKLLMCDVNHVSLRRRIFTEEF